MTAKGEEVRGGEFIDVLVPGETPGKFEPQQLKQYLSIKGSRKKTVQLAIGDNSDGVIPNMYFVNLKPLSAEKCGLEP